MAVISDRHDAQLSALLASMYPGAAFTTFLNALKSRLDNDASIQQFRVNGRGRPVSQHAPRHSVHQSAGEIFIAILLLAPTEEGTIIEPPSFPLDHPIGRRHRRGAAELGQPAALSFLLALDAL